MRPCAGLVAAAMLMAGLAAGCASVAERRFQAHINYLAGDELEGRGVGSRGIELAAHYIAEQFRELGLEPAGVDGTYFQPFQMPLHRTLTDASRLAVTTQESADLRMGEDFVPFNFSSGESFSGGVTFCGYGIVAPDRKHDDFAGIEVSGRVALMLRGEPLPWTAEAGEHTRHAMFRDKVYNAKDRGAVAVLIVNQSPQDGEPDELVEFASEGTANYGIPAFHIKRTVAELLLKSGGLEGLDVLQERADAGGPVSVDLSGPSVSGQAVFKETNATTRNVLALLRGNGPLADELVVVGAHYDHLGIRKPMMRKFHAGKLVRTVEEPQIHNGADDNASGTSGVIEVARTLAEGPRPRRSVLFIAFTGEESGLHGSKYYMKHPTLPDMSTVAMLNMDMVGRLNRRTRKVLVFGARSCDWFMDVLERDARRLGLSVASSADTGGRSDHAPFIRKEIPSMHFFTGFNGDYHKPSDDSDKINASGGAKVVALVSKMAYEVATRQARPVFVELKPEKPIAPDGTPSYRVVMGITPGYGDDGKPGMAVDGVTPEGPADVAGMKADDRIIRISGHEVANIQDYMAATRTNSPGDIVEVVILRGGVEHVLRVTLAPAR